MCGIVGFTGIKAAAPILLDGLSKLEYRGYDSAGIAVYNNGVFSVEKTEGRLKVLSDMIDGGEKMPGFMGIGHTRWATHGSPSTVNAHPHTSNDRVAVVHNGIIENYIPLREFLKKHGYVFVSETDTEVVAHLVDYYYNPENPVAMMQEVIEKLEGSYALGVILKDKPDEFYACRKDSPLIVGLSDEGNFIASDIPAILPYTRSIYLLEDKEIVILNKDYVEIYDLYFNKIEKEIFTVDWDIAAAEKGGYEHFMIKEIMEQPKALRDTVSPRIQNGKVWIDNISLDKEYVESLDRIYIVACGSAYHVGVVGKYVIEQTARIPVEVDLASEFRYRSPILTGNNLVIIISQSGETADTLAALREAKRLGARTLSIVNVVGSSIARESDDVIYTWAGPEISVATTKAYSTQLNIIYLIAQHFGILKGLVSKEEAKEFVNAIQVLPELVEKVLNNNEKLRYYAAKFSSSKDVFFIGRGVDYAVALEGSLKLKEISYIHSEAYAAGELKHGTISLIEDNTLVIALATQDNLFDKMLSNIKEVKSRGAVVLAIAMEGNTAIEQEADYVIYLPECHKSLIPSLAVLPLQVFGYYVSVSRGCDVDKPRNLAKSVTVE